MAIDTLIAYAGVYDDVADAEADYQLVKELHTEAGLIDAYDAAVVERRDDGKAKIVKKHETPTRVGGVLGGGIGLATGLVVALFPFAAIGGGLLVGATAGGALLGAVAGHAAAGMSRHDLKELGEHLDAGQAGLVVVAVSDMGAKVERAMKRAAEARAEADQGRQRGDRARHRDGRRDARLTAGQDRDLAQLQGQAREQDRAVRPHQDVVLEPDAAGVAAVDARLDREHHPLGERRRGRGDEERRLVDLDADRVAGAVQALSHLPRRLDDRALRGVHRAGLGACARRRDGRVVGLADHRPGRARPLAGGPDRRAPGEVPPVAVELRGDVGADDVPGASVRSDGSPWGLPAWAPKRISGCVSVAPRSESQ